MDGRDRLVLEFTNAESEEPGLRVIASLTDNNARPRGLLDWFVLSMETDSGPVPLLMPGWHGNEEDEAARLALYEKLIDGELGPEARGLSAASDLRTGPYARGDVLELLRMDVAAFLSKAGTQAGPGNNIVPFRGDRLPAARAEIGDVAAVPLDVDYAPVVKPAAMPEAARASELERALAALPDDLMEPALQAFRDYLGKRAGGGGSTAGDVEAFVAEGMRELHAFQTAHLEGRALEAARSQG